MRLNIRTIIKLLLSCSFLLGLIAVINHVAPRDSWEDAVRQIQARIRLAAKMGKDINFWELKHSDKEIDWHNYELIAADKKRVGPGEQGQAYHLPPDLEQKKDEIYKTNGFNGLASDQIALNRSIPDIRHPKCHEKKYLAELPTASIVVPFHNEHWSTLLRTAYSCLNRAPANLIEIILVDDASTKDFLKDELDQYVKKNLPKVKIVHLAERSGLIIARSEGARVAKGDVLIFLDSHSECMNNWLPPLLDPIARDYRNVVCPFIDVIDFETFEYRAQDEGARGAFDWEFFYKRLPLLPEDLQNPAEPFRSPVMAGGLFAISRKWFWELGGYDEGLQIWGGEQYELSFKLWQCGGTMVDHPCSRIGHIYRKFAPFPNGAKGDFIGRNYRRVAEVWMDEYAEYIYKRRPHYRDIDAGDLTEQKAVRERLNCRPFKWFMKEVAFDLMKKYPPVEPPDFASGEIRSVADSSLCIDAKFKNQNERFNLDVCSKDHPGSSGEQKFALTWHKDIRPHKRTMCWDVSASEKQAPVLLWGCHGSGGNQLWRYDPDKMWLIHGGNPRCLDHDPERRELFVSQCDVHSETQKWSFENANRTALANFKNAGLQIE